MPGRRRRAVTPSFPLFVLHPVLLHSLVWSVSAGRGYSIWQWNLLCYPDLACEVWVVKGAQELFRHGCVPLSSALPISSHWHVLCLTPADNGEQKHASSWNKTHQTISPQSALVVPSCGMYSLRHEATKHGGRQHQSQCLFWTLPQVLSSREGAGYPGAKIVTFPQNGICTVLGFCVAVLLVTIKGRTAGYRNG